MTTLTLRARRRRRQRRMITGEFVTAIMAISVAFLLAITDVHLWTAVWAALGGWWLADAIQDWKRYQDGD